MTQYQICKENIMKLTPSLRSDLLGWLRAEVRREAMASEVLNEAGKKALDTMAGIIGGPVLLMSRQRLYMYARAVVAVWLVEQGWSLTNVGKVLKKNHSTVSAILRNARDYEALPVIYFEYIDMKKNFYERMK